ncbi:hypothetical protein [Mycolicibacterium sp. S2-37]|nr:hypothetical protein [Mycolicibacterium sp. S2-37]
MRIEHFTDRAAMLRHIESHAAALWEQLKLEVERASWVNEAFA